ncbi:putative hypothetical protein [Streptomyces sp. NBRC 110611]|nr:putative hypothetical protein [Streptomyces sp. NBRC 110611]
MADGHIVHGGALISCPHGGRAISAGGAGTRAGVGAEVLIDGASVVTAAEVITVSGCPHSVDRRPRPCTTIRWPPDADDHAVRVDGVPVLLTGSTGGATGMCFSADLVPQGPPVIASVHRGRGGRQGVSSR